MMLEGVQECHLTPVFAVFIVQADALNEYMSGLVEDALGELAESGCVEVRGVF